MSTWFELRLLRGQEYQAALDDLGRIAGGDGAALAGVREFCLNALESESFGRWNDAASASYYRGAWQQLAAQIGAGTAPATDKLAEMYIALRAMPDYQCSPYSGSARSPNLVLLGDDDGGLYGVLEEADPPSFHWLMFDYYARHVSYRTGRATAVLQRDAVARLSAMADATTPDACRKGKHPEACWQARERLKSLLDRCLALPDGLILVSEC